MVPPAVVEMGIAKSSYTILEGEGMAEVCVELAGLIERSVAVNISTVPSGQAEGMYGSKFLTLDNTQLTSNSSFSPSLSLSFPLFPFLLSPSLSLPPLWSHPFLKHPAGVDYVETSATLVYEPSGSAEQLLCQEVPIQNDTILENTESFDVTISTNDRGVNLTRSRVPVYIQDDDGVRVSIEHREYSVQEEAGTLTVCTTLDGVIERNVQLMLHLLPNTAQGDDWARVTELLSCFPP